MGANGLANWQDVANTYEVLKMDGGFEGEGNICGII